MIPNTRKANIARNLGTIWNFQIHKLGKYRSSQTINRYHMNSACGARLKSGLVLMHLLHLVAWLPKPLPYELVALLVPSSPGIRRIGSSVGRAGQYKIRDGCQPRIWVLVGELSDWNKGNLPRNKHVRYRSSFWCY